MQGFFVSKSVMLILYFFAFLPFPILSPSLPRNLEILYHMSIILYFYPLEKPVYEKWEPSVIMSFSNDYLRYKEWNES